MSRAEFEENAYDLEDSMWNLYDYVNAKLSAKLSIFVHKKC